MTQSDLLDALSNLLPAQLETLLFKLQVPPAYLPGINAPQATRVIDALRWADQAGKLQEVERLLAQVSGKSDKR